MAIHRSMTNAAFTASTLAYLQDAPISHAILYRGDSVLNGMFDASGEPFKKFHVFKAMAAMLQTPQRLAVTGVIPMVLRSLRENPATAKQSTC
jgi:hypothetical protein